MQTLEQKIATAQAHLRREMLDLEHAQYRVRNARNILAALEKQLADQQSSAPIRKEQANGN